MCGDCLRRCAIIIESREAQTLTYPIVCNCSLPDKGHLSVLVTCGTLSILEKQARLRGALYW